MRELSDSVLGEITFEGKDVFEIGIGYGGFALEHLLNARAVFGIDTSREAVAHLEEHWPIPRDDREAVFEEGDIVDISLAGRTFDIVVFANSF